MSDGISRSWIDLHRLRASFEAVPRRAEAAELRTLARTLAAIAVPLCARELAGSPVRRAWAVTLLRVIAQVADERVRVELRAVASSTHSDDAKLAALALLAELGDEHTTAQFADPRQAHQQSLAKFASQLATPAEVASAADLLVSRLPPDEIVEFVEAFSEADPERARELGDELAGRVDLDLSARGELSRVTAPLRLDGDRSPARPLGRPALLTGVRHPDGRVVIAVARRVAGEQRWRSLATLCASTGALDEVFYDEDTTPRRVRDALIAPLLADGYARFAITTLAARRLVASAAQRAVSAGRTLPSPYYLGRDLLGLADSHLLPRSGSLAYSPDRAALLGRAVDLLAAGSAERARPLLEHCVAAGPDDADALASLGLCRFAQGEFAGAMVALERAVWIEPTWPLHQWNLAAAAHRAGELGRCARALRGFLDQASEPLAAAIDPEHAHRVALARRFLVDHARELRSAADHGLAPST